jgi:hypothetical protein
LEVVGGGPDDCGFAGSLGLGKGCGVWAEPLAPISIASSHPLRTPRFMLWIISASIGRIAGWLCWFRVPWNLHPRSGV